MITTVGSASMPQLLRVELRSHIAVLRFTGGVFGCNRALKVGWATFCNKLQELRVASAFWWGAKAALCWARRYSMGSTIQHCQLWE